MNAIETTQITEIAETTSVTKSAAVTPAATRADQDALAESLAQAAPSAGQLSELVCERLSAAGRLDAVVAWERLVRHSHAGLIRALSALVHADGADQDGIGMGLAEMEVCAALAWSPSRAQGRLIEADALTRLFPATLQHLSDGSIALEQARCLAELTGGLEDAAARAVEARVIARMPGQRLAVTRQAIRRAILRADPEAATKRHKYERARRRVELRPEPDGMATLSFYLPADIAQMAMRTLTAMAQNVKRTNKNSSDKRTLDQRRADLLPALLTRTTCTTCTNYATATTGDIGGHCASGTTGDIGGDCASGTTGAALDATSPLIPARVNVVVGIETLLGLSHEPGHLQGYGPICAEQTRRIAHTHAARWSFLLTATDGALVDASRTYTPTAAIKRLTQLRHTTCAFPHCAMPAERCDLDHNQPYHKGGPTSVDNLAPLCRTHHNAKSLGHWGLDRQDDIIRWTSRRTGRRYTTALTRYQPTPVQPAPIQPTAGRATAGRTTPGRPALIAG